MRVEVEFISPFTRSESGTQRAGVLFLVLSIRDLRRLIINEHDHFQPGPLLFACLPGESLTFAYGPDRLNWVIGCRTRDLAADPDPRRIRMRWGRSWIRMPRLCLLDPAETDRFEAECRHIRSLTAVATSANRCLAEMGVSVLVRRLLDQDARVRRATPAGRLRELLDDPAHREEDLRALSRQLHYSDKHLRMLFQREFFVSPKQYRDRQRMARAMELIAGTGLSIKEIAAELGFKHLSHFSMAFRRTMGLPATEVIRAQRGGRR